MWQCSEKVAAVAGGCVVAASTGGVEAGTAVGAVMGAAGIFAFFGERRSTHGPESAAYLSKVRRAVLREIGDRPEWDGVDRNTVENWDWLLSEALPDCMLDRCALAAAIVDHRGFPAAATEVVVGQLAKADAQFGSPPAQASGQRVITSALSAAYEDQAYFTGLAPYFWGRSVKRSAGSKSQVSEPALVWIALKAMSPNFRQLPEARVFSRRQPSGEFLKPRCETLSNGLAVKASPKPIWSHGGTGGSLPQSAC